MPVCDVGIRGYRVHLVSLQHRQVGDPGGRIEQFDMNAGIVCTSHSADVKCVLASPHVERCESNQPFVHARGHPEEVVNSL